MTTPFGDDVDPEVNCTKAMSSSVGVTALPAFAGASSMSHAATSESAGHTVRSASRCGRRPALVITARAAQDRSTAAVDSRYRGRSLVAAGG